MSEDKNNLYGTTKNKNGNTILDFGVDNKANKNRNRDSIIYDAILKNLKSLNNAFEESGDNSIYQNYVRKRITPDKHLKNSKNAKQSDTSSSNSNSNSNSNSESESESENNSDESINESDNESNSNTNTTNNNINNNINDNNNINIIDNIKISNNIDKVNNLLNYNKKKQNKKNKKNKNNILKNRIIANMVNSTKNNSNNNSYIKNNYTKQSDSISDYNSSFLSSSNNKNKNNKMLNKSQDKNKNNNNILNELDNFNFVNNEYNNIISQMNSNSTKNSSKIKKNKNVKNFSMSGPGKLNDTQTDLSTEEHNLHNLSNSKDNLIKTKKNEEENMISESPDIGEQKVKIFNGNVIDIKYISLRNYEQTIKILISELKRKGVKYKKVGYNTYKCSKGIREFYVAVVKIPKNLFYYRFYTKKKKINNFH